MAGEFTHLHLHTSYSLLDGAIRMEDLFPKVLEQGMKSVAMTDHGNMFGVIDFYKRAKDNGVKPIFGTETYVAGNDRNDRTTRKNHHLILLARNEQGYKNLSYLNSMGYLEGFHYHPRIDKPLLRERAAGLIGLSACLGSELAQAVLKDGVEKAKEVAREYRSFFEPGCYFLEVMPNGLEEQATVNEAYRKIGRELDIPVVATNDCHYVNRGDYKAHEILMCIQQGKTIEDEKRLSHKVDAFYIKSPQEMEAAFSDWPEVLENTARISDMCNVDLKLGKPMLPNFKVPDGYDPESYVEKAALDGLERRFREKVAREGGVKFDPDEYRTRLTYELGVIKKMGFASYFLIVWDFINWAKEHGIPVGPGRGSGAGSVAAWALRITDIDPITFKLIFERFLNPERVSMPDFDVDFCMERRDEVIKYVTQKYGKDNVGQIATFHQLKSRGVIRDIARVMSIPYAEADKVAKLVPEPVQGKSPKIDQAIAEEPRLQALYDNDPKYTELLDIAKALEGLNRHVGMHAAGVVISENPLWEYVPCFRGQNGEIVTQFAKDEVELAGLVKFDFLGLKTLTVIDKAVKLIRAKSQPDFDIDRIALDDQEVYKMVSAGDTTGVFQLESSGFREILKKLKPDQIEDIVAAVALYRPGPLEGGMVDDFIDRKHGKKKVVFPHPSLAPILKDTYGVIVYQEQVMQIAQVMAGYSLGQADLLRRAMGKKKAEVMAKEKAGFMAGSEKNGIDATTAGEVFDLMAFFAGYGFNRSHSAAYAIVTYQTAFLKRHYPHEFMAGLLSCDRDKIENIVKFIAEARQMGLTVERPDVNDSDLDFTVVPAVPAAAGAKTEKKQTGRQRKGAAQGVDLASKVIRFGMGAVKGVGEGAVEAIIAARKPSATDGPGRPDGERFSSIFDFCSRVDGAKVNKRVVEALVQSGAFDSVGATVEKKVSRARMFAAIETAMERAAQAQRDRKSGQTSLFGMLAGPTSAAVAMPERYPEAAEWSPKEVLGFEKESLGFYITGHPLDRYQGDISRYANATTADLERVAQPPPQHGRRDEGTDNVSIGIVAEYRERPTKSGNGKMAFFNLQDQVGQVEVVVFPKTWEKLREVFTSDEPLLCTGRVVDEGESGQPSYRFLVSDATPLAKVRELKTTRMHILLNADMTSPPQLEELKGILSSHRGTCATYLHIKIPLRSETIIPLGADYAVAPSDDLLLRIERLFGDRVAVFR